MASTNHTANLGLPQWEGTDAVERGDFNGAFEAIDAAVSGKMETVLIRDVTVPRSTDVKFVSVDLSDVDFGDYVMFFLSFPYFNSCYIRFTGTDGGNMGMTSSGAVFAAFPLKNGDLPLTLMYLQGQTIKLEYDRGKYSKIQALNLVLSEYSSSFDNEYKMQILGVR